MRLEQLLNRVAPADRDAARRRYYAFVATAQVATSPALAEAAPEADALDAFARALHGAGLLNAEGLAEFRLEAASLAPRATAEASYELVTLVGRGGMGDVYLGSERKLRRVVAVKRLREHLVDNPSVQHRFIAEAQVTAQLDHPAIVPVYGMERASEDGLAYAMKFVRGVTLAELIAEAARQRESRPPSPSHALKARVELIVPVLNALAYAHRRGVVHRDLKPDNVMVGSFGEVLVMDWGIARVISGSEEGFANVDVAVTDLGLVARRAAEPQSVPTDAPVDTIADTLQGAPALGESDTMPGEPATVLGVTVAGTVMGTPGYMSPEQARGEPIDGASDQFTLGLILQELVTLRPARLGGTVDAILVRARSGQRVPILGSREPVPRELRAIILQATAPVPAARYPSVEAMADDVRRFLRDESVAADPDTGGRRVQRWVGRHRALALAIGAGLLLLSFAVAGVTLWRGEVALAEQREAAQGREAAVQAVAAAVDVQARAMSGQLHRCEVLLAELAAAARIFLGEPAPPSDAVVHTYVGGQRSPPDIPPGAVESRVYGQLASARRADFAAAPSFDATAGRARVDQLARLEPVLRRTLLASASEDATTLPTYAAERLVLQRGVPLVWTYFGSVEGLSVGMPGTWNYSDSDGVEGYDHRAESWYRTAADATGAVWDSGVDENGLGLVLSLAQAVRDDSGDLLGVAAVDLAVSRFIHEHLDLPGRMVDGVEALLLNDKGNVLVRSGDRAVVATLTEYDPPLYEEPIVVAAMGGAEIGHIPLSGRRLAFWTVLGRSGLTYLVVGSEAALLAGD